MGWETHGVCVKSDGGWLGEVHHSVAGKKNRNQALGLFERMPATFISSHAVHFNPSVFFIYHPHTSAGIVELRHINPTLCSVFYTMCFGLALF